MRPLTVITGILLGTSLSIACSLAAVLIIFFILRDEYPRLGHEFGALVASFSLFTAMTMVTAGSFYALVKHHPSRWLLQGAMWVGLSAICLYYWP